MKIKKENKKMKIVKGNNKEENSKEVVRVFMELSKTDIYYIQVDIPRGEKENSKAIEIAWNGINNKLFDVEKARIGGAFSQKILKKLKVEYKKEK